MSNQTGDGDVWCLLVHHILANHFLYQQQNLEVVEASED